MTCKLSISSLISVIFLEAAASFFMETPVTSRSRLSTLKHLIRGTFTLGSAPLRVDRVTICMGELCKCQEENSDVIMKSLKYIGTLPFSIDESPCLGACGVGAMVSIEYDDGSYNLVTGLQETLVAAGLHDTFIQASEFESSSIQYTETDMMPVKSMNEENVASTTSIKQDDFQHDAIQRMREEATNSDDKPLNPWIQMVLYLINKAKESS